MTIKELLEKYDNVELTKEQEEHIKKCLEIKDKKWRPQKEEKYWCVTDDNYILNSTFYGIEADVFRIFNNNCFKTKEEAEFILEQIKVYNELKNFADENNEEMNFKSNTIKYHIFYDYDENKVDVYGSISVKFIGQIYFSSRELTEQAIEKVGEDRIKKYLFGVE